MKSRLFVAALVMLAFGAGGCAGLTLPRLFSPGPARDQRARAQKFDPFPERESAPALAGVRPRDFDRPLEEPVRAQFERWSYGRSQSGP